MGLQKIANPVLQSPVLKELILKKYCKAQHLGEVEAGQISILLCVNIPNRVSDGG